MNDPADPNGQSDPLPSARPDPDSTLPPPPDPNNTLPHLRSGPPDGRPPAAGAAIPGCTVLREIGRGGMGVVYEAWQDGLNRTVAVKMVLAGAHAGPAHLARFRNEAKAIALLRHPNVVQVHHVGDAAGVPFLVLEFCPGGSLAEQINGRPWLPDRAAGLVEKVARGVQAAHTRGIVHRDLKPGNVLLDEAGEPKVTDFGLAKLGTDSTGPTATDAVLGTPSYMAPEQTGGRNREVGPATDVYGLGAILYELLTGRPPFLAPTPLDTMLLVAAEDPVPPRRLCPGVPEELEAVCLKCLAKAIPDRYPDAGAVADDLRRFREGEPVSARPPGLRRRFADWRRKHPDTTIALTAAVCPWLVGLILFGLLGAVLTAPAFAGTLAVFVRPTRRVIAWVAGIILVLAAVQYGLSGAWYGPLFALGLGVVPAVPIGAVSRVVARVMRRDPLPVTIGSYFGFLVACPIACCGLMPALVLAVGPESVKQFEEARKKDEAATKDAAMPSAEEQLKFFQELDHTRLVVIGGGWLLVAVLVPTTAGAVLAGFASRRRANPTGHSPEPDPRPPDKGDGGVSGFAVSVPPRP